MLKIFNHLRFRSGTASTKFLNPIFCSCFSLLIVGRLYRIIENDFFKHDWRSMGAPQRFQYVLLKWTICFLIGIITGLVGFFNNLAVENISGIKFVITSDMMSEKKLVRFLDLMEKLPISWLLVQFIFLASNKFFLYFCRYFLAFGVFTVINFVLVLFSSVITACFAPSAAGSGIPEVKSYLNGVDAPGVLAPRTLLVKVSVERN